MQNLKQKLIDYSKNHGIDLIGFASKERFGGIEPRLNPFSIFPEGETVIMLGKRICRGALRGVEEGTNFEDYKLFGNNWLEDSFLTVICYDVTRVLEDEGWEAVPIFPNPTEVFPFGVPVKPGKLAPNVHPDFNYAAVAAGLAEISVNGLVFTPKYGSRQRFHMIITDAKFEPDPILEQKICDHCGKCARVCPLGAISKTETEEINICGKIMKVAKIDYKKCKSCANGAVPNRFISTGKPDRIAALCNRICINHLEQNELISNRFENRFIQSQTWALDADQNYVTINVRG